MKIKTKQRTLQQVLALPPQKHKKPKRPWFLFRLIIRVASQVDLWSTRFTFTFPGKREVLKQPCLILMNHSSFLDLEIASRILFPRPYCIVSTTDGMVGKSWLMERIGCIPTQKFVSDLRLIRDMKYALKEKKTHVLMYPEAGYSFDGCATALPQKLGACLKLLDVPVVMITTYGAFARDPLYNGLQKRKVKVRADCRQLLSREEIASMSVEELDDVLKEAFSFDQFAWQREQGVEIREPFRADGLERILYKCAACGKEGTTRGVGTELSCSACGKTYHMDTLGRLVAREGKTEFSHIPDWYRWERECVRKELEDGSYRLDTPVTVGMLVDHKALYMVGEGHLLHTTEGFLLTGCSGELRYEQKPLATHSLNSDYYWYEIGDVIGIGNAKALYYCFPTQPGVVTKTRLATEELYRMRQSQKRIALASKTEPT
ncbi:MAG: 1-acyl-sn-glycerol-3-phosphate acyltransferase [Clostridia bacterium]|nr:1-acyl-sn-glycerol-3-phosphate acyltransferase [Clostridia bacterium]